MSERKITLQLVRIAAPCHEDLDAMPGDDRQRFCNRCEKHVQNLSAMTRDQAEAFINANPTGACIQMSRDRLGQIVTADDLDDSKLRPLRQRRMAAQASLPSLAILAGGVAMAIALSACTVRTAGAPACLPTDQRQPPEADTNDAMPQTP